MKINVWDIPTRIFHWSLVAAFTGLYLSSLKESYLEFHVTAGYAVVGLIVFRVLWGFTGNRFARFSNFLKGWGEAKVYLSKLIKGNPPEYFGHNPLVGWAVVVMISMIIVITLTGIITYGGEENRGVFAGLFLFATAQYAHAVHEFLAALFIPVIAGHISAALIHEFYFKEKMIGSMVTGRKDVHEPLKVKFKREKRGLIISAARTAAVILLAVTLGWTPLSLMRQSTHDYSFTETPLIIGEQGVTAAYIPNETWESECADACHGAFHPTLLPAKSWKGLMADLENHFGEDAAIDEEVEKEIIRFLVQNSAERSTTEASQKILWFLEEGPSPLRVTETPFWEKKHSGIGEEVFNRDGIFTRTNCTACHMDAVAGLFEDRNINIPKPDKGGTVL